MFRYFLIVSIFYKNTIGYVATEDVQFLNELPLDKLLQLKTSLQDFVTDNYENVTESTPYLQNFGAQALAMKAPPIKRTDYEDSLHKKESYSKISNIFSMSVTTLAFLAFGGYLLCLIVQAVKAKQNYNPYPTPQPTTFFVSAGIKKKPQPQFASYGRKRRDNRIMRSFRPTDLPPDHLFDVLLQLCEGYAKWSEHYGDIHGL